MTTVHKNDVLVREYNLTPDGKCLSCQIAIPGIWSAAGAAEVQTGEGLADYQSRWPRRVKVS
jgi:hypothetical protein